MSVSLQDVRQYYDNNTADKLRDFVEGNARIERAWSTIERWAPKNPKNILEIGCGIGHVTARLGERWPEANVTGLDVSPRSLEIARTLFCAPGLTFVQGPLARGMFDAGFDMIVLLDVYEHIACSDRPSLHVALADLLHDGSRVILSFPTPRVLVWSRKYHPLAVQPVDEDVDLTTIQTLAQDIGRSILLYDEVDVWHEGDYAHAVLGTRAELGPPVSVEVRHDLFSKICRKLGDNNSRSQRLALVHKRLVTSVYPA